MFSLYDTETGKYLHTGRNSKTKKEAINNGIDYILSDGGTSNSSQVKRMSLEHKEAYLGTFNLIVDEHKEGLAEADWE